MNARTLVDFVCRSRGARVEPDHVALCNAADAVGAALAARGVEPGDVVATVLPPGPVLTAALIGAAAIRAALAPLAVDDLGGLERLVRGQRVRAVLATPDAGMRSPVAGVPVLTLTLDDQQLARVDGDPVFDAHDRVAEPDDVVLLIPPHGAPLSQAALIAAAGDRGLDGLLAVVQRATEPSACAA